MTKQQDLHIYVNSLLQVQYIDALKETLINVHFSVIEKRKIGAVGKCANKQWLQKPARYLMAQSHKGNKTLH